MSPQILRSVGQGGVRRHFPSVAAQNGVHRLEAVSSGLESRPNVRVCQTAIRSSWSRLAGATARCGRRVVTHSSPPFPPRLRSIQLRWGRFFFCHAFRRTNNFRIFCRAFNNGLFFLYIVYCFLFCLFAKPRDRTRGHRK